MHTHPHPTPARPVRRVLGSVLLVPALGGCLRNPAADIEAAQAITEIADRLGAMQQDNAALQNQIDSLRMVVARQDTVLRRLANMAGVPMAP